MYTSTQSVVGFFGLCIAIIVVLFFGKHFGIPRFAMNEHDAKHTGNEKRRYACHQLTEDEVGEPACTKLIPDFRLTNGLCFQYQEQADAMTKAHKQQLFAKPEFAVRICFVVLLHATITRALSPQRHMGENTGRIRWGSSFGGENMTCRRLVSGARRCFRLTHSCCCTVSRHTRMTDAECESECYGGPDEDEWDGQTGE